MYSYIYMYIYICKRYISKRHASRHSLKMRKLHKRITFTTWGQKIFHLNTPLKPNLKDNEQSKPWFHNKIDFNVLYHWYSQMTICVHRRNDNRCIMLLCIEHINTNHNSNNKPENPISWSLNKISMNLTE